MRERPILFSAPMILALLDERKTMTRRVIKWPVYSVPLGLASIRRIFLPDDLPKLAGLILPRCPYGQPGSFLWVREAWWHHKECRPPFEHTGPQGCVRYEASEAAHATEPGRWLPEWYDKKPSIFMPRWASRILLEITAVRVERVQDISEEDVQAEGIALQPWAGEGPEGWPKTAGFAQLWDSLNAKRGHGWDANPFVWAITFKRVG